MWIYQGASGMAENFSQLKYYYMYKNKTSVKLIFLMYIPFAFTTLHTVSNRSLFLAYKLY